MYIVANLSLSLSLSLSLFLLSPLSPLSHTPILQGVSECYECQPKPAAKTFPGCTIRNTPSEPIHCIVWAKHLFSQLFGEPDADNDVSPETEEEEEGEKMEGKGSTYKLNVCR